MNRQAEIHLDLRTTAYRSGYVMAPITWRSLAFWAIVFVLFSAVAVPLLVAESRLTPERRQQAFETLGLYP